MFLKINTDDGTEVINLDQIFRVLFKTRSVRFDSLKHHPEYSYDSIKHSRQEIMDSLPRHFIFSKDDGYINSKFITVLEAEGSNESGVSRRRRSPRPDTARSS